MLINNGVSPQFLYAPDGGGGSGDGGAGDKGTGANAGAGDTVPKADHDKLMGDVEKLKQDLEDTRLEVMTPEYIEFLNSKSKKDSGAEKKDSTPGADELSGLTPQQIYAKAISDAGKRAQEEAAKLREEFSATSKEATQKEVAQFARSHNDYEQFRPLMYGLSLEPKHRDSTLQELYEAAKVHVSRIHTEPTDEQKKKSRSAGGEKPGSSSGTVVKDKKYTPEEAAREAWNEVVGSEGLPSA